MNPPPSSMLKECSTIEEFPDGSCIKYMLIGMPMMTPRDNVLHIVKQEKDGHLFCTMKTIEHPTKPVTKGIIRMFSYMAFTLKQEGDDVVMHDCEHFDMKGYMPAFMLNMTIASETAKEFTNMMKNIKARQTA